MPLIDIITFALIALVSAFAALMLFVWLDKIQKNAAAHFDCEISILFEDGLAKHSNSAALVAFGCDLEALTWDLMYRQLRHRFKLLPSDPTQLSEGVHYLRAHMVGDTGLLTLEKRGAMVELSLPATTELSVGQSERLLVLQSKIDTLERACGSAPYPMWQKDEKGTLIWSNAAYDELERSIDRNGGGMGALFDDVLGSAPAPVHRRVAVTTKPDGQVHWYDTSLKDMDGLTVAHAVNIDAVIDAEVAQRNFVQTLAKTFAQLSIGLAIFDRKGQLALFNPALVDLTRLPAEFLSTRPDLLSFFDRLRENRMMPEPKNYGSWRQEIADLIKAAADGRYLETWTLESGQTYRVSGKPHPDRAVAFLIEDITAQVNITRNFRAELDMGQSMMDALSEGLAVFSPAGVLSLCNRVYSEMWGFDPDRSFADITINDSVSVWQANCMPTTAWRDISDFIKTSGPRKEWSVEIQTRAGNTIRCTVTPVTGGATMVQFHLLEDTSSTSPEAMKVVRTG
ncbi:PAS-domain containing protein [Pseudosulfitobacter pseudonitzschiae]|uniref:PAS-domain containing protein n=1 Tax=Pseudosulfitobacter pseudonitzschiae TaxID=1402135 RepID=UPI001AF924DD|nr:PAS-domain containing protein [Pseudosulfitobacter pseudonitzschiae]MBM1815643.1 PAS-domain containing protein [Pseudosulfitobacter pseudonitzschiae]MBM1832634.1 PAS-domain containing protein [Pseudosulfitobacter pseudonitzschiae]MBM1837502.1 PAS-domain containing protein [Pseudosulfitobacter pseudonitzschiae]MBM1842348.1 PAS-domain containing protein [Pseudosulfitobacter pseudonitzschiae]MBM1847216.1 PAS-domain containing protein [Pseudosulfitobacter pseudonitzschiae]